MQIQSFFDEDDAPDKAMFQTAEQRIMDCMKRLRSEDKKRYIAEVVEKLSAL